MANSHRALCLALALSLSFALGLEPQLAAAQGRPFEKVPGKLDMQLKLPAPVMRNGAPFPLQLDFTSTFPDVIEGPLELTFYDEGILQLRFLTTPIVIAADSSTAYSIQLPSLTCVRTPTEFQVGVVLQSARKTFDLGKHDLLISLRGTRQFVIAAPGLNEVDVGQLVRSLSLDEFRPRKLNRQNFATYPTELDPHRILGDPMGLYPYDVVVLVGQHFSALSPRQLETVATWTESGGGLVVVPSGVITDAHSRFLAKVTSLDLGSFQTDALGRLSPLDPGDSHRLVSGNYGFGRVLMLRSIPSASTKDAAAPSKGREADGDEWIRAVAHLWNVRSDQVDTILKTGTWQMPEPPPPKPSASPVTSTPMPKMLVRTDIRYSSYGDVGGLVTQPPAAANALRDMLFPADVRVVPFGIVIGLLASFLVVVAPGDYWILGWLRRRRFTWIVFPIVSLMFTAITVAIAGYYSGNTDHRNSLVIVDLARDGRPLRTSRIMHVITADTHMLTADVRDGLFTKTEVQPAQSGSDQPNPLKDPLDELPVRVEQKLVYEGVLPAAYMVSWLSKQWSPAMHRMTRVGSDVEVPQIDWAAFDRFDLAAESGRERAVKMLRDALPECALLFATGKDSLAIPFPAIAGDSAERFAAWPDVLTSLGRRTDFGLMSILFGLSPNGAGDLEDLAVLDDADSATWLVHVAVIRGEDLIVFRHVIRKPPTGTAGDGAAGGHPATPEKIRGGKKSP
jgi:hypothetical protein